MKLVIAEKPSVAQSIATVLEAKERKDGYFKGNDYIVSWCVGHLVELAGAESYNPEYEKWKKEHLPIIPEIFNFKVKDSVKKQYKTLELLMKSDDVTSLVCATDAGREGESIFRFTYNQIGCKKPFERLWISSMEDSAIKKGFENLKPSKDYDNLYDSAISRSIADWIVGINATRLYTLNYKSMLSIGRVQTPTVAMIVERELAIANFIKEKFFDVDIIADEIVAKSEKINSEDEAKRIMEFCNGKDAICKSFTKVEKNINPPKLYDLTTLQRECNRKFGYTAQETLNTVQKLYEDKIVTYPRTDSQYITDDMEGTIPNIVSIICKNLSIDESNVPVNTKIIVNNAKVSDHTAILPTKQFEKINLNDLKPIEKNILLTICARLLISIGDKHTYIDATAIFDCEGYNFTSKGKSVINDGFKAIEKVFKDIIKVTDEVKEEKEKILPVFTEGQIIKNVKSVINEKFTSPQKRFTEDTLLSAMENATNKDYAESEDIEKKGLGTPATRAGIIEKIIRTEYVKREKKQLVPTEKGINLIFLLPIKLKSPKMTAEWEVELQSIEKGEINKDEFLNKIKEFTKDFIVNFEISENQKNFFTKPKEKEEKDIIGVCPRCNSSVYEGAKKFYCGNNECKFSMWKEDKFFTIKKVTLSKKNAKELLSKGRTKVSKLYSQTKDTYYEANVLLNDTGEFVNYKLEFIKKDSKKK